MVENKIGAGPQEVKVTVVSGGLCGKETIRVTRTAAGRVSYAFELPRLPRLLESNETYMKALQHRLDELDEFAERNSTDPASVALREIKNTAGKGLQKKQGKGVSEDLTGQFKAIYGLREKDSGGRESRDYGDEHIDEKEVKE